MENNTIDIDKIMKKINAESYSIEKSNANSALIKLRLQGMEKIIVVIDNPVKELLNSVLFYNTNYDKILWVYNREIEEITNNVNRLTGRKTIVPINLADV